MTALLPTQTSEGFLKECSATSQLSFIIHTVSHPCCVLTAHVNCFWGVIMSAIRRLADWNVTLPQMTSALWLVFHSLCCNWWYYWKNLTRYMKYEEMLLHWKVPMSAGGHNCLFYSRLLCPSKLIANSHLSVNREALGITIWTRSYLLEVLESHRIIIMRGVTTQKKFLYLLLIEHGGLGLPQQSSLRANY